MNLDVLEAVAKARVSTQYLCCHQPGESGDRPTWGDVAELVDAYRELLRRHVAANDELKGINDRMGKILRTVEQA